MHSKRSEAIMRLKEIMSSPVETATLDESADEAYDRMRLRRIHHLVVVDGKAIVGVLSERDLGGRKGASLRKGRAVADVMTEGVHTAAPTTTVREAANLLRGHVIGCIPVVERGKLVGMVTIADLLELIGRGAERPVAQGKRWTLKHRGPRARAASATLEPGGR